VRFPATYGSSQCGSQHHSPDPSRPACRRLGFRAWNIAEQAWRLTPASTGALGCSCTWSGPTRGDLGVRSGHLARWHNSGARVRLADGSLKWPEGGTTGVELELNAKRPDCYQPAVADVDPAWSSGVWWFTPRAQVGLLQQRLQDAGAGAHPEVVTAPEGVAP
jgi:hypothetical protein